jgi:hypoxanthine phosphoribosyltransferase
MVKYLKERGAASVVTAALHYKKTSIFKPDFFIEQMDEWQWIVYPWSIYEDYMKMLRSLSKKSPHNPTQQNKSITSSAHLSTLRLRESSLI